MREPEKVILTSNDFDTLVYVEGLNNLNCVKYQLASEFVANAITDLPTSEDIATDAIGSDGLIHPVSPPTTVAISDTSTITSTIGHGPPGYDFSLNVNESGDAFNSLEIRGDGLYVPTIYPVFKFASISSLVLNASGAIPANSVTPLHVSFPSWTTPWTASLSVTNNSEKQVRVLFDLSELMIEFANVGVTANVEAVLARRIGLGTWSVSSRQVLRAYAPTNFTTRHIIPSHQTVITMSAGATVLVEYALALTEVGGARNFSGVITAEGTELFAYGFETAANSWLA